MRKPGAKQFVFSPWTIAGIGIMAFGVFGLFLDSADTRPDRWVRWFVGGALVHDLIVAPIVIGVGLLVALVPRRFQGPVQGALISSAIVGITAFPFVGGFGRRSDNPSALPNDYAAGLLWVLAVIWAVAGAWILWRLRKGRRQAP